MDKPKNKGGRPKGSLNKRTLAVKQAIRNGVTPLEFLLDLMRDEAQELNVRIDAAKSAAPYVHQRLAQLAVEHKGEVFVNKVEYIVVNPESKDSPSISSTH